MYIKALKLSLLTPREVNCDVINVFSFTMNLIMSALFTLFIDLTMDTTLDVDRAGPDCDLQDDDFRMLEEDDGSHESVGEQETHDELLNYEDDEESQHEDHSGKDKIKC